MVAPVYQDIQDALESGNQRVADVLHITETPEGIIFTIRVLPRSSRSGIAGIQNGLLKIKITAPPLEGRANEACVAFLADLFGVSKGSVQILGGAKSKNKRVFVAGVNRTVMESIMGNYEGH